MPAQPKFTTTKVYTTDYGAPVSNPVAALRAGPTGPLLLQDTHLIELLAHFDRERIPERVVHAKGAGAYGYFEVTHDISDLTCASFLNGVGKKTEILVRFSTVGGEKGSADTARDPRGFSIKFYTEDGINDWVFNNTPIFFLRDPAKFPLFIHTQKRNPRTNLKDPNYYWGYFSTNPESIHQVMILFSDRGTPDGFRHMHCYSGHTFKFVKENGDFVYVQIHCKSNQGIKTLDNKTAVDLAGTNPDYGTEDLANAIDSGEFPSWTVSVQVLTPEQASQFKWDINDLTKVWPQKEVPLRPVGKFTLNRNVSNYFAEVEQAAFSPSNLVPGIEPSADPVLQSRLFSYPDTHRHRLGPNFLQLPVNAPKNDKFHYQRDGFMNGTDNFRGYPNFVDPRQPINFRPVPSTVGREQFDNRSVSFFYEVQDVDFVQPKALWDVLGRQPGQQDHFVSNVACHLGNAELEIRQRQYKIFSRVDSDLGRRIEEATELFAKGAGTDRTYARETEYELA